jgi:hypothetical protein
MALPRSTVRCGGDNRAMQALRNASFLARLALAWFALYIGVAVASPFVKPVGVELICSGAGAIKLLVKSDEGGKAIAGHTLDCPLCAAMDAPPGVAQAIGAEPVPLGHVLQSIPAARIAALTAAPLPARGPPASLFL